MRIPLPLAFLCFIFPVVSCDSKPAASATSRPSALVLYSAEDAFTFEGPPDLVEIPTHGIDSYVGEYRSPTMKVSFDYGWYSSPLKRKGDNVRKMIINGESATLVTKPKHVAIHFPDIQKSGNKLTMDVKLNGADPKEAENLLLSIRFR